MHDLQSLEPLILDLLPVANKRRQNLRGSDGCLAYLLSLDSRFGKTPTIAA